MRIRKAKPMDEATFDLTNMIDVVLLLIIFFMLSSQFAQADRRPMRLPTEKGEAPVPLSKHMLVIDVLGDGSYGVFGKRMGLADLARAVEADVRAHSADSPLDLVVRAERDAPSTDVNRLAVALAAAGIRSWRLATAGAESP